MMLRFKIFRISRGIFVKMCLSTHGPGLLYNLKLWECSSLAQRDMFAVMIHFFMIFHLFNYRILLIINQTINLENCRKRDKLRKIIDEIKMFLTRLIKIKVFKYVKRQIIWRNDMIMVLILAKSCLIKAWQTKLSFQQCLLNCCSLQIVDIIILAMYQNIENIQAPSPMKCAKVIKIINLSTGALIVAFGLVGIIFMAIQHLLSLEFFLIFSPLFIIVFGIALLAIELKSNFILQNFGFLRTLLGRAFFNFYVSTQVYYFFSCGGTNNPILAWTTSMILFGLGILYLVLHFAVGRGYAAQLKEELA